jgi:hypothetical protein
VCCPPDEDLCTPSAERARQGCRQRRQFGVVTVRRDHSGAEVSRG